jgi:hypothetical protein
MPMMQQENGFAWPLLSENADTQLCWRWLGSVTWLDGFASFPRGPDEPGVYLVKLVARGTHRIYIGEAANLRKRLRSFGGRGAEHPIERGKTTTNMRGRIMLERIAISTAYLRRVPLINEHGFPKASPDDPLQ